MYIWYMSNTVTTKDLRENLAEVIDHATHDEVTYVTRRGRQVAAVVPISVVENARKYEEAQVAAMLDKSLGDPRPNVPMSEVLAETLARTE